MTMDLPQPELGGSKETAPGLEHGPLMILMIPSNTTALITKSTCVLTSTTEKSTLKDLAVSGTGKHTASVIT